MIESCFLTLCCSADEQPQLSSTQQILLLLPGLVLLVQPVARQDRICGSWVVEPTCNQPLTTPTIFLISNRIRNKCARNGINVCVFSRCLKGRFEFDLASNHMIQGMHAGVVKR